MNFKPCFFAFFILSLSSFIACNKDDADPLEHLVGTWTLSSVNVDGQAGSGTGTITFNEDLTGTLALTYIGGGIQITRGGSFTYSATNDEIDFSGSGADPFTWERTENKNDEQEFEFVETVGADNYDVRLNFTK